MISCCSQIRTVTLQRQYCEPKYGALPVIVEHLCYHYRDYVCEELAVWSTLNLCVNTGCSLTLFLVDYSHILKSHGSACFRC